MPAISLHWPAHKPCRLCYYTQWMTLSDITTREVCGKAMGFQVMFVLRLPKLIVTKEESHAIHSRSCLCIKGN